ncbi:MAG: bifunctional diaminohydroxyphosphoribosylaminopyrimidine deaminase/5-amino-6-(5-phosphoribosylamino)uracil reductase RibD [Acidobacteria bacterium]|nr:bifunctional diaminohydroxyphosphoribosylaminopyrimidine deaminase/5-amino-6-(5-phosphoribosylamino)uracil reductase RibD [Acidobacteriota bacterium]
MFDAADRRYMKKALLLGERGTGRSSPNPSVGCVIVRDGRVVGRGWHEYALRDHAEVRALRMAGELAAGSEVYVTLEPCCHEGRTPPCADALVRAGVRRVVAARPDPNPVVSGRGVERLRSAGIRVDVGLCAEEAGRLIEPFARHVSSGYPLVVSKVGMTLDGKIGTGSAEGRAISSPEGLEFGQRLRLGCDAVMVGVGTLLADDPALTYRGGRSRGRPLLRAILDSRLRTPPGSRLLRVAPESPVLLFCGPDAPEASRRELERAGAEIVAVPRCGTGLDLEAVLRELGARNILAVLVEGGSCIHRAFLEAGKVDVFHFIVAPLVLGGGTAVPVVGGRGYGSTAEALRFRIRRTLRAGPDVVLEAYPECSRSIISPWLGGSAPFPAPGSRTPSGPK